MDKNDLFSRQLMTYGSNSLDKLDNGDVIIYPPNSIGVEVCKNLLFSGVNKITILDLIGIDIIEEKSLYYSKYDKGKNRLDVLKKKLKEMDVFSSNIECIKLNKLKDLKNFLKNKKSIFVLTENPVPIIIDILHECLIHYTIIVSLGVSCYVYNNFKNKNFENIDGNNGSNKNLIIDKIEGKDVFVFNDNMDIIKEGGNYKVELVFKNIKKVVDKDIIFYKGELINNLEIIKKKDFIKFNHENFPHGRLDETCFKQKNIDPNILVNIFKELYLGNIKSYKNTLDKNLKSIINTFNNFKCNAIDSYISGIGSQEVLKYILESYTPINQWMVFEFSELLNILKNPNNDNLKEKILIVGAGAIGCEVSKNLVLSNYSNIIICDPDVIENSNLSRQVLFKKKDVKKFKSSVIKEFLENNFNCNIFSYNEYLDITTENIFDDYFFKDIKCIVGAVDNIKSRRIIDYFSHKYNIPYIDAGTTGLKCNTQVIIPKLTQKYTDSNDPEENNIIPICTIKSFPTNYTHCVSYSLDFFNKYFNNNIKLINDYSKNFKTKIYDSSNLKEIEDIVNMIPKNYNQCLTISFNIFNIFKNSIIELLIEHPIDEIDTKGNKFWNNLKKPPKVDIIDNYKSSFIENFSKIYSKIFKLNNDSLEIFYEPVNNNLEYLKNNLFFEPIIFDKDCKEDMDFIFFLTNLRCDIYDLRKEEYLEIKKNAGNIIPATITATSIISGIQTIEIIKIMNQLSIENFYNTYINLIINTYLFVEPIKDVNSWDEITFNKKNKISELLDFINNNKDIIEILYNGKAINIDKIKNFKDKNISYLKKIFPNKNSIILIFVINFEINKYFKIKINL